MKKFIKESICSEDSIVTYSFRGFKCHFKNIVAVPYHLCHIVDIVTVGKSQTKLPFYGVQVGIRKLSDEYSLANSETNPPPPCPRLYHRHLPQPLG
jgi:hypothetical protein